MKRLKPTKLIIFTNKLGIIKKQIEFITYPDWVFWCKQNNICFSIRRFRSLARILVHDLLHSIKNRVYDCSMLDSYEMISKYDF